MSSSGKKNIESANFEYYPLLSYFRGNHTEKYDSG